MPIWEALAKFGVQGDHDAEYLQAVAWNCLATCLAVEQYRISGAYVACVARIMNHLAFNNPVALCKDLRPRRLLDRLVKAINLDLCLELDCDSSSKAFVLFFLLICSSVLYA